VCLEEHECCQICGTTLDFEDMKESSEVEVNYTHTKDAYDAACRAELARLQKIGPVKRMFADQQKESRFEIKGVGSFPVLGDKILTQVPAASEETKRVTIAKIDNGIVIDHIPAGKSFLISKLLKLSRLAEESGDIIVFGVNFDSPTLGKKDVIKVENLSLTRHMLRVVSLIAPTATIVRIQDGVVIEKHKAEIPDVVDDVVVCPDRSCITRNEEVPGKFKVLKTDPLTLKCHYCETEFYGALIRYKESTDILDGR
jgi:aspartate carbamoyltransferase regulatory subunit